MSIKYSILQNIWGFLRDNNILFDIDIYNENMIEYRNCWWDKTTHNLNELGIYL
jgi:hypothetical protein